MGITNDPLSVVKQFKHHSKTMYKGFQACVKYTYIYKILTKQQS